MRGKTHDEFVLEMKIKNPEIEVCGKYINKREKVEVKCKVCGRTWLGRPGDLLKGTRCSECVVNKRRKTHEDFVDEINKINPNIEILSKYENYHSTIKCKCKVDGYVWFSNPANLINQHGCPKCAGKYNRTHDEFVSEIKSINPNIEILSEFINVKSKVKCRCKIDNHIWFATPNLLLRGTGCKVCNESKGEKRITAYLKDKNILFEPQKSFNGLIGTKGGLLSYDFYIPEQNCLIEYQGEFHDGNIRGKNYKKDYLKTQQEHDKRKREYAKLHNINLIEIWYWDFDNIELILDKCLTD